MEKTLSRKEKFSVSWFGRYYKELLPFVYLFVIIIGFGIATGGSLFRKSVLLGILDQALIFATISTSVCMIYSSGNLDISIGNAMAVAAILSVMLFEVTGSLPVMFLSCIVIAIALMMFNCVLSTYFSLKPATVGIVMMSVYSLVQSSLLGNRVNIKIDYDVLDILEASPIRYILFFAYIALVVVLFNCTPLGRKARFIGGNAKCAEQSGISALGVKFISFIICGLGAGLSGLFTIIRQGGVSLNTGGGFGMECMLATVIGGMSIFGGAKSKAHAGVIGALTVAALNRGLLMVGVSSTIIQGIRGAIFLLLVYLCSEKQATLPAREQF